MSIDITSKQTNSQINTIFFTTFRVNLFYYIYLENKYIHKPETVYYLLVKTSKVKCFYYFAEI